MKKSPAKLQAAPKIPPRRKKVWQNRGFIFLVLVIVGSLVAGGVYYYTNFYTPPQSSEDDVQVTIKQVGKLMLLPSDETPTVAVVGDVTKLENQPFFKNAVNGDKVLIYNNAKKAILWRPSTHMIIEVAPVTVTAANNSTGSATLASPSAGLTPTPSAIRFVLYNGTGESGFTYTYETTLTNKVPDAEVVSRDNAAKTYDKSVLVNVSNAQNSQALDLSKKLGISYGTLPEGESSPSDADFLIILGKDQVK